MRFVCYCKRMLTLTAMGILAYCCNNNKGKNTYFGSPLFLQNEQNTFGGDVNDF